MKLTLFLLVSGLALGMVSPLSAAPLNTSSTLVDQQPVSDIPQQETHFDPMIDDLPLMDGLSPAPEEDTVFSAPRAGRIADSVAVGVVDVDDVYIFYRRTLPQLGWEKIGARDFRRNGEKLHIEAHADGKQTTVRFSVKPG